MPHANRSKRGDNPARNPTPEEMRSAREARGWTPAEAGKFCDSTGQFWEDCEAGKKRMHPATWKFWLLVTDVLPETMAAARGYINATLPTVHDYVSQQNAQKTLHGIDKTEELLGWAE